MTPLLGTIARTTARNLVISALFLGALIGGNLLGETFEVAPADVPLTSVKTPEAITLLADNDCWTGKPPPDMRGVLPGHVVVMVDGDARLGGERLVGKALDQTFGDADFGLTVVGFCR